MARTHTPEERALLASRHFVTRGRVEVLNRDNVWKDLTNLGAPAVNWFERARWGADVDTPVENGTFELKREVGAQSLAPTIVASGLNRLADASYAPLLNGGRRIRLATACVTADTLYEDITSWRYVFQGKIDRVDWTKDPIVITCRDDGAWLQEEQLTDEQDYPEGTLENQLENLLITNPPKYATALYVPVSPNYAMRARKQPRVRLMQALRDLADEIGWDTRYRWDAADAFRLTLYKPPRDKTVEDFTLGPSEYLDVTQLTVADDTVRNWIRVLWRDVSGALGKLAVKNPSSIDEYGKRFGEVALGNTSNLSTQAQATELGTAIAHDLGEPDADKSVRTRYFPYVQLHDLIKFLPNGKHFDEEQKLGVLGWQHDISAAGAFTDIRTRGKIAGQFRNWLRKLGLNTQRIYPVPAPTFRVWAVPSADGGVALPAKVYVEVQFEPNVEYIQIFSETGASPDIPAPDHSVACHNYTWRRQDGQSNDPYYKPVLPLDTNQGYYRRLSMYGVGYDGQKSPAQTAFVQAGTQPPPVIGEPPPPAETTIALGDVTALVATRSPLGPLTLTYAVGASTGLPTGATPVIHVKRDGMFIAELPVTQLQYPDPAVWIDAGYTYTVNLFYEGYTGPAAQVNAPPFTHVNQPKFVNGTPSLFLTNQAGTAMPTVRIDWTCADPAADKMSVQRAEDILSWAEVFHSLTGFGAEGWGVFLPTTPGIWRLVSYDAAGNPLYASSAFFWPGYSVPTPQGQAPVWTTFAGHSFGAYVLMKWTVPDPGTAASVNIERRADVTDPWDVIDTVAIGVTEYQDATYYTEPGYYRLTTVTALGATIASSGVKYWGGWNPNPPSGGGQNEV